MLDFTVTVSEADYYSVNARLFFMSWGPRQVLLAFACGTALFASVASITVSLYAEEAGVGLAQIVSVGAASAAFVLAMRFVCCWLPLPGMSNKLYAQHGTLAIPTRYQLTEERFMASFEEGTSDHPWTRFCDFIETGDVLLLRRTPYLGFFIPMHQLSAHQREGLLSLLAQVGLQPAKKVHV